MTTPSVLDPNLFEMKFRASIVSMATTKTLTDDKDSYQLADNLTMRVDVRDMDEVLHRLIPIAALKRHNIESVDEWIQSIAERSANVFSFADNYKDHQVTARLGNAKIFTLANCQLTTFALDIKDMVVHFHCLAKGHSGPTGGALAEAIGHPIVVQFKRGEHWSKQEDLTEGEDGDAGAQSEID